MGCGPGPLSTLPAGQRRPGEVLGAGRHRLRTVRRPRGHAGARGGGAGPGARRARKGSYRDVEGGDHVEGGGEDGAHGFHRRLVQAVVGGQDLAAEDPAPSGS